MQTVTRQALQHLAGIFASRKTRVALATLFAAFAARWGWQVSEDLILAIVGVGASLILGIAHEDAGRNAARANRAATDKDQPA